jgi:hypothetical protein
MKHLNLISVLITAAFATFGCAQDNKPAEEKPAPAAPEAKVDVDAAKTAESLTLPELSPEEPKTKLGELPVAEDLEEEAEKSVNLDNIDLELDRLQAEIEG